MTENHTIPTGSVDLAGGRSATEHLHGALTAAREAFPEELGDIDIGASSRAFKDTYPELLPRFEAARAHAAGRSRIAATLVEHARDAIVWADASGEQPLAAHLAGPAEPFELRSHRLPGHGRLRPRVPFDGVELDGDELLDATRRLVERGSASGPVADAIEWIVRRAEPGGIDLGDRRIVVLGAAAELAPTRQWLEAGAEVLWIDVADPSSELLADGTLSGTLRWVPGGADLLTAPHRVLATVEAFAADQPVDIGLYAYAAGQAREWRLSATMNAIVDALPATAVRGVAMLVSPTTCGVLTADELAGEAGRRRERPRWQSALDRVGAFGKGGGHAEHEGTCTNRGIVSIQGGSYQAAQYLGKLMAAEAWATAEPPFEVSANTAGVSLTESLHHPVFDTAFAGAAALRVETFDPATTAHLNGLLTLHDRLDPPATIDLDALFTTRVHGGVYELPYPVEPALRVAAGLGVAKDPRRLASLVRRR